MKYRITFCGLSKELRNEQELFNALSDPVIQAYPERLKLEYLGDRGCPTPSRKNCQHLHAFDHQTATGQQVKICSFCRAVIEWPGAEATPEV